MKKELMQMTQGDLLIIAYKMWDNRIPHSLEKESLANSIVKALEIAGKRLAGQTLPADLHHINKML